AGRDGDPDTFRDHEVGRPATYHYSLDARHTVVKCSHADIRLQAIEDDAAVTLRMRHPRFKELRARLSSVETGSDRLAFPTPAVPTPVVLEPRERIERARVELHGLEWAEATDTPEGTRVVMRQTSREAAVSLRASA